MDLVYFVKDTKQNEELRYSLRSVCENLKGHRVVFVGGKPDGLTPDLHISFRQNKTKHLNVWAMREAVIQSDEVSEDFYLMNDDFFVMEPIDEVGYFYYQTLAQRIRYLCGKYDGMTDYAKILSRTKHALENRGLTTLNYELHVPMRINKVKGLEVVREYGSGHAFRSLYGNTHVDLAEEMKDVKALRTTTEIDKGAAFLSTSDTAFSVGEAGRWIRARFKERCRYEC